MLSCMCFHTVLGILINGEWPGGIAVSHRRHASLDYLQMSGFYGIVRDALLLFPSIPCLGVKTTRRFFPVPLVVSPITYWLMDCEDIPKFTEPCFVTLSSQQLGNS